MGRSIPRSASHRASAAAAARTSSADSGLGRLIMSTPGQATAAHVGLEVRRRQPVHPHDEDLAARAARRRCRRKACSVRRASTFRLSWTASSRSKEMRVGVAGQRLREELGPRGGHEQLAAHEEIRRAQARAPSRADRPRPRRAAARSPRRRSRGSPGSPASAAPAAARRRARAAGRRRSGPDAPCRGSGPRRGCSKLARMPSAATCGWSNMSSTGRAAAQGTRSPKLRLPLERGVRLQRRAQPRHEQRRRARPASAPCRSADRSRARAGRSARTAPSRNAACWRRCRGCRCFVGCSPVIPPERMSRADVAPLAVRPHQPGGLHRQRAAQERHAHVLAPPVRLRSKRADDTAKASIEAE